MTDVVCTPGVRRSRVVWARSCHPIHEHVLRVSHRHASRGYPWRRPSHHSGDVPRTGVGALGRRRFLKIVLANNIASGMGTPHDDFWGRNAYKTTSVLPEKDAPAACRRPLFGREKAMLHGSRHPPPRGNHHGHCHPDHYRSSRDSDLVRLHRHKIERAVLHDRLVHFVAGNPCSISPGRYGALIQTRCLNDGLNRASLRQERHHARWVMHTLTHCP